MPAYHPEATPATQFERDLKYVRDAHFAHVWIFSRKDGKELTKEDSEVLRTNAPKVVDWVTTELRNLAKQRIEDLDSSQVERTIEQYIDLDFPSRIEGLSFKVVPIAIYI